MGLPELSFSLQKAAAVVAARVSAGVVALILRDGDVTAGVYTVNRTADIPAKLSAANVAAVKRALMGGVNTPERIYLAVIGTDDEIGAGFTLLAPYVYDWLAGPTNISKDECVALADLVKEQRKLRYIGKAVLPDCAANCEGVVNFVATGIKAEGTIFDNTQYAGRIAGLLAGTPVDCSATYFGLGEVTGVDPIEDANTAIDAGKLILINDGRKVKLGRAVTSKVDLAAGEPELLKKIKLVTAVDLIRYYALSVVEDDYLGQCPNTYDNKCILLTDLRGYLQALERAGVLEAGSSGAELDADAIRGWLIKKAGTDAAEVSRVQALDDAALRKENTGSHVFIKMFGRVLDAMEDFHLTLEAE